MERLSRTNKETSEAGRAGAPARTTSNSRDPANPLLQLQHTLGNRAVNRLIQAKLASGRTVDLYEQGLHSPGVPNIQCSDAAHDEEARFRQLQRSNQFHRDPNVSSMRNYMIDQYEQLAAQSPEGYTGNIYSQVLPPSATEANYNAAAAHTARDPVNNRTRWALQNALLQYGIEHGYEDLAARSAGSTNFSYQIHASAFQFANGVRTINRLPWALLTHVNVPALGESVGEVIYLPEAFIAGMESAINQLALHPSNTEAANAAFNSAYSSVLNQRYSLGGSWINWTIEKLMRAGIEVLSFLTYPLYD